MQLHYGERDPNRSQEWVEGFLEDVRRSGSPAEFFEYPVDGHLFTDPSLPGEYDAPAAELLWERATEFCARLG